MRPEHTYYAPAILAILEWHATAANATPCCGRCLQGCRRLLQM